MIKNCTLWASDSQADANDFIMLFNVSSLFKCKGSKFQNWHTINTGATDHFLLVAQKAELGFLTSRNSKGSFSLKPLFLSAIKCHCLETWALSSGIHLTYMHIIKGESNINKKGLSDHKRRKKGKKKKHMTRNASRCQFHSLPLKLTRAPGRTVIGSVDCIYH